MGASSGQDKDNLIEYEDLDDKVIIRNLVVRFLSNKIYTYIGRTLLSLNPEKDLGLYTPTYHDEYKDVCIDTVPPHVYAVSGDAYRNLIETKRNQNIIISGVSGAGKTENAKQLLKHLTHCAVSTEQESQLLGKKINEAHKVFEAFGNAKTLFNANSSRHGRWTTTFYDKTGSIRGAKVEMYLLEKVRVVQPSTGEGNFHILHYIRDGMSDQIQRCLDLARDSDFTILPKIHDRSCPEMYESTMDALQMLGFSDKERTDVIRLLAAILHMGDIRFEDAPPGHSGCRFTNDTGKPLNSLAKILKATSSTLDAVFLKDEMRTPNEIVKKDLTRAEAELNKTCLCKTLYERLFIWIVSKINASIIPDKAAYTISVLDFFGFENFEAVHGNGFQQLCINLANEMLHEFFINNMWVSEKKLLEKEGVYHSTVNLQDVHREREETILIIEKVFEATDMCCSKHLEPKSKDEDVVKHMNENHISNRQFSKMKHNKEFAVMHYAGKVVYNVTGFLEKNKDKHKADALRRLLGEKTELCRCLYPRTPTPENNAKSPNLSTTFSKYKKNLQDLRKSFKDGNNYYVQCIKAIGENKTLERIEIAKQLRDLGVLITTKIRKEGFPYRFTFCQFVSNFKIVITGSECDLDDTCDGVTCCDCRRKCYDIIGVACSEQEAKQHGYQFGKTLIFMEYPGYLHLTGLRKQKIDEIEAEKRRIAEMERLREEHRRKLEAEQLAREAREKFEYEAQENERRQKLQAQDIAAAARQESSDEPDNNPAFSITTVTTPGAAEVMGKQEMEDLVLTEKRRVNEDLIKWQGEMCRGRRNAEEDIVMGKWGRNLTVEGPSKGMATLNKSRRNSVATISSTMSQMSMMVNSAWLNDIVDEYNMKAPRVISKIIYAYSGIKMEDTLNIEIPAQASIMDWIGGDLNVTQVIDDDQTITIKVGTGLTAVETRKVTPFDFTDLEKVAFVVHHGIKKPGLRDCIFEHLLSIVNEHMEICRVVSRARLLLRICMAFFEPNMTEIPDKIFAELKNEISWASCRLRTFPPGNTEYSNMGQMKVPVYYGGKMDMLTIDSSTRSGYLRETMGKRLGIEDYYLMCFMIFIEDNKSLLSLPCMPSTYIFDEIFKFEDILKKTSWKLCFKLAFFPPWLNGAESTRVYAIVYNQILYGLQRGEYTHILNPSTEEYLLSHRSSSPQFVLQAKHLLRDTFSLTFRVRSTHNMGSTRIACELDVNAHGVRTHDKRGRVVDCLSYPEIYRVHVREHVGDTMGILEIVTIHGELLQYKVQNVDSCVDVVQSVLNECTNRSVYAVARYHHSSQETDFSVKESALVRSSHCYGEIYQDRKAEVIVGGKIGLVPMEALYFIPCVYAPNEELREKLQHIQLVDPDIENNWCVLPHNINVNKKQQSTVDSVVANKLFPKLSTWKKSDKKRRTIAKKICMFVGLLSSPFTDMELITSIASLGIKEVQHRDEIYTQILYILSDTTNPDVEARGWLVLWHVTGCFRPRDAKLTNDVQLFINSRDGRIDAEEYCFRLEDMDKGLRKYPPYKLEVDATKHGQRHPEIQVHFPDDISEVFEISSTTTGDEARKRIILQMASHNVDDFSLYIMFVHDGVKRYLPGHAYIFDFIQEMELLVKSKRKKSVKAPLEWKLCMERIIFTETRPMKMWSEFDINLHFDIELRNFHLLKNFHSDYHYLKETAVEIARIRKPYCV